MLKKTLAAAIVLLFSNCFASSQIVISQYYEGPSTNKWIELFNAGPGTVDLSTMRLGLWTNALTENYKNNGAPFSSVQLSGSLASGAVFLIGNTGNTAPSYAIASQTSNAVINFNGNDSLVLYTGSTYDINNVVDAIGFTSAGNEGVDRSFVRTSLGIGWNTDPGSNVNTFSSVWSEVTLASVNSAISGTNEYLGTTTLTPVPEPISMLAFAAAGFGVATLRRRRRNA